jgi:cytochrome b6-f complex iron-sulfur subunit
MDRKEFLSILGIGTAALACGACFEGCAVDNPVAAPPTNVDFTLDLNAPSSAPLANAGGYIYQDALIVARVKSGSYAALSSACTHAGTTVYYDLTLDQFHCPSHGSNFRTDGSVANGPAGSPLMRYNTSHNGSSLRVYS